MGVVGCSLVTEDGGAAALTHDRLRALGTLPNIGLPCIADLVPFIEDQ
jgi:hypothetical protein